MPRPKNTSDALLADLTKRLARLVETARKEGHDQALSDVRSLIGGSGGQGGTAKGRKKATKPAKPTRKRRAAKKSSKPRKNPWAGLTPEQRLKRVNAIRKGRGLPPKKKL